MFLAIGCCTQEFEKFGLSCAILSNTSNTSSKHLVILGDALAKIENLCFAILDIPIHTNSSVQVDETSHLQTGMMNLCRMCPPWWKTDRGACM